MRQVGLCTSDRGRYCREELLVQKRDEKSLIPPYLAAVAAAWDNCDMHGPPNNLGSRYLTFCAASFVGIRDSRIRFQPEEAWTKEDEVRAKDVMYGVERDDDKGVFYDWELLLIRSAIRSAGSDAQRKHTCLEAEIRKVSVLEAQCDGTNVKFSIISTTCSKHIEQSPHAWPHGVSKKSRSLLHPTCIKFHSLSYGVLLYDDLIALKDSWNNLPAKDGEGQLPTEG